MAIFSRKHSAPEPTSVPDPDRNKEDWRGLARMVGVSREGYDAWWVLFRPALVGDAFRDVVLTKHLTAASDAADAMSEPTA